MFSLYFIFKRERNKSVFIILKTETIRKDSWGTEKKGYKCLPFIILKCTIRNERKEEGLSAFVDSLLDVLIE